MKTAIRITVEYYDVESQQVIETGVIRDAVVCKPEQLKDLGYLHSEQLELLQSLQDFKIRHQSVLCNDNKTCPCCRKKSHKLGLRKSKFHAALTDHEVSIQRRKCTCGWSSPYTVEAIYGSSLHPDLLEKQALQGAENSYRQASRNLSAESCSKRSVNSIESIRKNSKKVALIVGENKLKPVDTVAEDAAAEQLIAVIDGGYLKAKDQDARSFEAMTATVYRPENIRQIDKHHNEITQKTSVASALSDHQRVIKTLVMNACRKEGAVPTITQITCLTDGASNCWSIADSLQPLCHTLTRVLDWFHITKRFTVLSNGTGEALQKSLESVKWHLWHGDGKKALARLVTLISETDDKALREKLESLLKYIENNQDNLVNYQRRQAAGLPFTSTLAEVTVNCLINSRQKRNQKMQWGREGAHDILQIRSSLFSKSWKQDWVEAQNDMYKKAA